MHHDSTGIAASINAPLEDNPFVSPSSQVIPANLRMQIVDKRQSTGAERSTGH
ncbi:hypothetical protein K0M31_016654 [Melipona bicolor]|uniref:Uncharacterized protein n=1 Tax=Melipona bicolor TaxID=60889 RepID=A0AA40FEN1_9HYME|nr:hypothetical protein K0M31_016654 [Melipona bicolor]